MAQSKRQFGSICRRGDAWQIQWTDLGKRRSKTIHGTREDAEAALAAIRYGYEEQVTKDVTWGEYVATAVEKTYDGLADHTLLNYRRAWDAVSGKMQKASVATTTWRDVDGWLQSVESPGVQRLAFAFLRKAGNLAVRDGILLRNPCDRSIRLKRREKREKPIPDAKDAFALADAACEMIRHIVLLSAFAGLRYSEACAVTAEDVLLENGRAYITVDKAEVCVNGRNIVKCTKNRSSVRTVALSGKAAVMLDASGIQHTSNRRAAQLWRKSRKETPFESLAMGMLRSCFATWCGEAGVPDSLASLAMGHSDGTTRGRNYQQRSKKAMEIVADMLAEYLEKESCCV